MYFLIFGYRGFDGHCKSEMPTNPNRWFAEGINIDNQRSIPDNSLYNIRDLDLKFMYVRGYRHILYCFEQEFPIPKLAEEVLTAGHFDFKVSTDGINELCVLIYR